jgi:hypothetical protein
MAREVQGMQGVQDSCYFRLSIIVSSIQATSPENGNVPYPWFASWRVSGGVDHGGGRMEWLTLVLWIVVPVGVVTVIMSES